MPLRKLVLCPHAPWLLHSAAGALVPLLAAEFETWRRVGCLPSSDARSRITNIPKPDATPDDPAGLRGIAVGTHAANLCAVLLERRLSAWAERTGQFGFRCNRSTSKAALELRTLQDTIHGSRWARHTPQPLQRSTALFSLLLERPAPPAGQQPGLSVCLLHLRCLDSGARPIL